MSRFQVASLGFALGCLVVVSPAGAAGKYDGSKPMLCAVTSMSECTADGKCERSAPQAGNNVPMFVRVDVGGKLLTDNDGSGRKTEIKIATVLDGRLMLQGGEYGKAWTIVIALESGMFGSSVVEDDGLFALFGACTLP
jgi:hypothetical protein